MRRTAPGSTASGYLVSGLAALLAALAPACASGGSTSAQGVGQGFGSDTDASGTSTPDASTSSSSSGGAGDDSSGGPAGNDGSGSVPGDDGGTMDDAASGSSSGSSSSGGTASSSGSSSSGSSTSSGGTTYACVTPLSPAPVCDTAHKNCLCTANAECNSNGLNIVNNGGCNSHHCTGTGTCTGGQFTDSAGCSVVAPTCNLGGNQGCPANTACEINHGGCGGSIQCCWCTSDSACPVSQKCVNDATQNQCNGHGPCTGSGTSYDGMHCELASPGIPLCTVQ